MMNQQGLFYLITGIVIAGFLVELVLEWLNYRSMKTELLPEDSEIYDPEKYHTSVSYQREHARVALMASAVQFATIMAMLLSDSFGRLDSVLRNVTGHPVYLALLYFGILAFLAECISLPFQIYGTFVIEKKYGFNRTNPLTFITDKLKGYVLGVLVGGGLLALLVVLIITMGKNFWLWFLLVTAAFMLFMNAFYTTLILPLFNKLTPLEEGELKSAIEEFAGRTGFPLQSILVMDGSRRSTKANAFFAGLGRYKKIILYDTLVQNYSPDEILSVLAHETGHYRNRHIQIGYLVAVLQVAVMLFLLSRLVFSEQLSLALGAQQHAIHLNLLAFAILFTPVSLLLNVFVNALSRKHEYEADSFAARHADGKALARALKKLSVDTLTHLHPHPLYVLVHYSHPPLVERLRRLQA
jgi:STE24 endopeptidase